MTFLHSEYRMTAVLHNKESLLLSEVITEVISCNDFTNNAGSNL